MVQQLSGEPAFQEVYLRELFNRRTSEYNTEEFKALHALQLDLLLRFDSPDLLFFLETSQEYDVPTALNRCLHSAKPHIREAIYLYSRLGDTSRALHMIVQDLGDVDMALEFVQKWKDRDLWDDLVKYSISKPTFVGGRQPRGRLSHSPAGPRGRVHQRHHPHPVHPAQDGDPPAQGEAHPRARQLLARAGAPPGLQHDPHQRHGRALRATVPPGSGLQRRVKSKMAGIRLDPDALCTICQQELFQIRKATRTCPPPAVVAFHCS